MKVAVIGAKGLPPNQGGIEHYCAEVYPRMVAQGYSVDLFGRSSYTNQSWYSKSEFKGVQTISLPSLHLRGIDAFTSSALGALSSQGKPYDIVHFHALGPALFSWLPQIASASKVVVTCQGLDWQRAKWGNLSSRLIQLGEQAAVRYANEIIVVSKALQKYFLETYGRETVYIPNAPASYVESDSTFAYTKSLGLTQKKYIIYLGRLVPEKCPDVLIKAFQSLQAEGWKLVFVGGGSDTAPFTSELTELAGGNPNILFAGEHRGAYLAELVRGAGLFVLPSDLEGLPLAMLEGMLEGIPVVASDIPPHQQLVGDDRGLLFQAGSVEACAQALDWAVRHPEEMQNRAATACHYVQQNYTWDHITAENIKLYENLCASSAEPIIVSRG